MRAKCFIAVLLFMVASLQTSLAQGFRVYQNDGTQLQFSLKTDSIVFDNGLNGDEVFGPFTAVNQCITKTWYMSKTESVTFNANGTTDYIEGATYKFFPYQGNIVFYNASGAPISVLKVYEVTNEKMVVGTMGADNNLSMWSATLPVQLVTGITLSETSVALHPDDIRRLTATVMPSDADNPALTWESSNDAVAEVNQTGRITANAVGTCTITCRATDGSCVAAECSVTVTTNALVTNITLNKTSLPLSLPSNTTQTLTATILPSNAANKNVSWSSNNTNVATVSSTGKVTAVAVGTCTITCSAKDGSGVKATCEVTVVQNVTSITLSNTSLSLSIPNNTTQTLTASVLPTNAANKNVSWSSNNTSVATVSSAGKVTAVGEGSCIITCSATDGSGVKTLCEVTVTGHEYVDLGLPSGTLWATCNVGASSPEGYGSYFAWGETTPKSTYNWSTYKYFRSYGSAYNPNASVKVTKYCTNDENGTVDNMTELVAADDAATANWGSGWQMPSLAQWQELFNSSYTTTTWTTQNGFYGRKITSKLNGKSIFLPAAGFYSDASFNSAGSEGHYWSRTLGSTYSSFALFLNFSSGNYNTTSTTRDQGASIRPVRKQ